MGFILKDTEPSPAQDSSGVRQKGDLLGPPPVVTTCRSGLAVRTGLASYHQTFACLCMRGCGRKLVAIQTESCVCSRGGSSACCSEPCGDLLTELLSPGGRKRLTLRMPDKVSETAAGLSA